MDTEMKIVEEARRPLAMNPKKFALWLFMASVLMMFASLTSAYMVRQAEGNWLVFDMPQIFWVNTAVIIISSLTLHVAYLSAKRDSLETVKLTVGITVLLGIAFLVGQFLGWGKMVENNVHFVNNQSSAVSGSFVYVLSGLHGVHIISGVIFLLIVLASTFRYRVHSKNMTQLEMCVTYWHFLGGLWLYLFGFLILYR